MRPMLELAFRRRSESATALVELISEADQEGDGTSECIFDSYAALYQGLAALERQLRELRAADHDQEIEYRLIGEGSRCLGDLLTSAEKSAAEDPAMSLVVCWGVDDVLHALAPLLKRHRGATDAVVARRAARAHAIARPDTAVALVRRARRGRRTARRRPRSGASAKASWNELAPVGPLVPPVQHGRASDQ
jgi:hypothetical protein